MATTNAIASSRVLLLLLDAILAAVASVQGQAAPSVGGLCTPDYISELGSCVDFRLERPQRRGLPRFYNRDRCCENVRGKPNAAGCLCTAFRRDPEIPARADFSEFVNDVLFACDGNEFPDITCPASTSF